MSYDDTLDWDAHAEKVRAHWNGVAKSRQRPPRTFQEWLEGPEEDLFGDQPEAAIGDPGALGRE